MADTDRITEERIHEDIVRFSQLHSWYKHLPLDGSTYYPVFRIGLQPRNSIEPTPVDERLHVWFTINKPNDDTPGVTFNRFLRGLERYSGHAHIVGGSDYWKSMHTYMQKHHPEIWPVGENVEDYYNCTDADYHVRQQRLDKVFATEHSRQVANALHIILEYAASQNLLAGVKLV